MGFLQGISLILALLLMPLLYKGRISRVPEVILYIFLCSFLTIIPGYLVYRFVKSR